MPKILVACEYSGVVRDAFTRRGWDAWSCDLEPTEKPGNHIQGDVLPLLSEPWDMVIAHPPCTYLSNSGVKWLYEEWTPQERVDAAKRGKSLTGHSERRNAERWDAMREAGSFFNEFRRANANHIAIENPVMHRYGIDLVGGKATQFVQPYHFGVTESKRTGLRLYNLPKLIPTNDVKHIVDTLPYAEVNKVHWASPGPNRWKERSRTYKCIAQAMADQWGTYVEALL